MKPPICQIIPILTLCCLLQITPGRQATAQEMIRYVSQSGSTVSIKGSCNLHDYRLQGKEITGEAEFSAALAGASGTVPPPGKLSGRLEGFIPVRSLHYGVGPRLDEAVHAHLKAETHPHIQFRFHELNLREAPRHPGATFIFDARGDVVVSGVTNEVKVPIQVVALDETALKLSGRFAGKMSDFGVTPPKFPMVTPGADAQAIVYRDEIEVNLEWRLARKSATKSREGP